jgi:hypothetical protein
MKWLVSATTAIVIFYAVIVAMSGGADARAWLVVAQVAAVVSFCLIPLSIGAAVLRYRLYEIDVIVRRTVVYTVLVGMLVVVYLASVSALGWVGRELTGQSGALAVTLSTLLVAVSFQPLRTRIQNAVDRRFLPAAVRRQQRGIGVQQPATSRDRPGSAHPRTPRRDRRDAPTQSRGRVAPQPRLRPLEEFRLAPVVLGPASR